MHLVNNIGKEKNVVLKIKQSDKDFTFCTQSFSSNTKSDLFFTSRVMVLKISSYIVINNGLNWTGLVSQNSVLFVFQVMEKIKTKQKNPNSLELFLRENHVNPDVYFHFFKLPRYVRVNPYNPVSVEEISKELQESLLSNKKKNDGRAQSSIEGGEIKIKHSEILKDFLSISPNILNVCQLSCYKQQKILGMDITSGIACQLLDVQPWDHVLDLCCAPGNKLLYLSQLMKCKGTITGVDIDANRIQLCQSLLIKYRKHVIESTCHDSDNKNKVASNFLIRLMCMDGTQFDRQPPQTKDETKSMFEIELSLDPTSKKDTIEDDKIPYPPNKRRKVVGTLQSAKDCPKTTKTKTQNTNRYDKVIVDSECTSDGSIRNVHKKYYKKKNGNGLYFSMNLIETGFQNLKSNGNLVYCTCSFDLLQNEFVIDWLYHRHKSEMRIEDLTAHPLFSTVDGKGLFKPGHVINRNDLLKRCLRFDPVTSNTSGFFIAKIVKL
ncbi:hypothetical protein RFI_01224 [Reticulomyxa filosa]|uniref:SAM-dependent MTase RsmB/NOP-type domain-containing protein n=1 Tax=Reticulomyxa filosa TaxID=46433 RepID=X6PBB5_RETFI|nr:hypothetical protein RFI_01224 [Reticulomyxa filosa]|eukprot:ETO35840.1 hypothetical protein RFI_01224 [Reticulomyxa filosa]